MRLNRRIVAGAVAGLAVAGAGGAIAATELTGPREESQAIINDAAQRLGIAPAKLSDALKKALEDRVDAAVQAGRLTKAEGDAIKQRIESGDAPFLLGGPFLFGGPRVGHHVGVLGLGHGLGAAASYLGLTEAQLRTKLDSGKTLAQIAKDQGKSVDGLVEALVADAKKHLDQEVKAGRLTEAQETSILADVKRCLTNLVNGTFPGPPRGFPRPPSGFRGFGPDASFSVGPGI